MGARGRLGAVWPLFDLVVLVVRTPRLEVRLPREDEFPDLVVGEPATPPTP